MKSTHFEPQFKVWGGPNKKAICKLFEKFPWTGRMDDDWNDCLQRAICSLFLRFCAVTSPFSVICWQNFKLILKLLYEIFTAFKIKDTTCFLSLSVLVSELVNFKMKESYAGHPVYICVCIYYYIIIKYNTVKLFY